MKEDALEQSRLHFFFYSLFLDFASSDEQDPI